MEIASNMVCQEKIPENERAGFAMKEAAAPLVSFVCQLQEFMGCCPGGKVLNKFHPQKLQFLHQEQMYYEKGWSGESKSAFLVQT